MNQAESPFKFRSAVSLAEADLNFYLHDSLQENTLLLVSPFVFQYL